MVVEYNGLSHAEMELNDASIDSGVVSQLADRLEVHSESQQRCTCRHAFLQGGRREEQALTRPAAWLTSRTAPMGYARPLGQTVSVRHKTLPIRTVFAVL
jgi:hypothetical protein